MIKQLLNFVREREAIRIAKEAGKPAPWTIDPILQQYRFCNVRRRDDRVSRWLLQNVYSRPFADSEDSWFVAAICRYVNWPPAIANLLFERAIPNRVGDFDAKRFADTIDNITVSGGKAWTGAYMIYPGKKETGISKGLSVGKYILAPLAENAPAIRAAVEEKNSVEALVTEMCKCYGWSPFMAGQVAADLTYTDALHTAVDLHTYAPLGPGSQRGLSRLFLQPLNTKWPQEDFNAALETVRERIIDAMPELSDLTLHDVQNVMCEADKYWRVMNNEGRPRSTYSPETRF